VNRGTVNVLAAALVVVGLAGFLWNGHVVFVLVGFAGLALKIEDWIKGGKQ
jgi:hypothetical protein